MFIIFMRIHSFSKTLVLPLLAMVAIVYYLYNFVDGDYSILIMIPVALAVAIYIFHGEIDFWYLKKKPYGLDQKLIAWLEKYFWPYIQLGEDDKKKFTLRLELYLNARLIQAMGSDIKEVPEDIKASIAGIAVWMTLNQDDFLIGDFDRIFLYKHHFPTPANPELHAVEVNQEDGVILLNSQLAAQALIEPDKYYNVAVHAFSEAIQHVKGAISGIDMNDNLSLIAGWQIQDIEKQTGLKGLSPLHVHVHHYFVFPDKYRNYYPNEARELDVFFNKRENV